MTDDRLVAPVIEYYSGRFREFGATAAGVDWNSEESQLLRFAKLLEIHDADSPFSLLDFGSGYGALAGYLQSRYSDFAYVGFDLAPAMIEEARSRYGGDPRIAFLGLEEELVSRDYTVASGVFNVRLDAGDEWEAHALATLDRLWELSSRGFAFNLLTSYSDPERMRPDLWYADPREIFDHCKRRYSRHVTLLHDYGLYEFTMLIRRQPTE